MPFGSSFLFKMFGHELCVQVAVDFEVVNDGSEGIGVDERLTTG